jgi:hypothetical protein
MEHATGSLIQSQVNEDQKSGKASNFDDEEDEENEAEISFLLFSLSERDN